jgi:hypothetical protein
MIVVASHVNFNKAWYYLRDSFVKHGVNLKDVVVVVGGSEKEEIIVNGDDTEVYITVPHNFYEYVAIYGIHKFIDHPRIKDNSYLLVHDTSIAMEGFADAVKSVCQRLTDEGLELLFLTKTRQLNQLVLSYDFVKKHGMHYGYTAGKDKAWALEHGAEGSFLWYADKSKVANTDNEIIYGPVIQYPDSDIYRHQVLIHPIRLMKLVGNNDDINPHWQKRVYP